MTIPSITNEEFKNKVVAAINAFEKQGYKSSTTSAQCMYHNGVGGYCIIGHMMPDDETRMLADSLEFSSVKYICTKLDWAKQFSPKQIIFLQNLQDIHDEIDYFNDNFDRAVVEMKECAKTFFGKNIFK